MNKWRVESREKKRSQSRLVIITSKSKESPQKPKQPKLIRLRYSPSSPSRQRSAIKALLCGDRMKNLEHHPSRPRKILTRVESGCRGAAQRERGEKEKQESERREKGGKRGGCVGVGQERKQRNAYRYDKLQQMATSAVPFPSPRVRAREERTKKEGEGAATPRYIKISGDGGRLNKLAATVYASPRKRDEGREKGETVVSTWNEK